MLLFLNFFMCHYCLRVETELASVCKSAKVSVELDSVVSVSLRTIQSYLWGELRWHYFLIPSSVSFTLFSHLITLTGVFSKMLDAKDRSSILVLFLNLKENLSLFLLLSRMFIVGFS